MGKKFGFSFSLKRASGLSAAKGKLSRKLGVPLTRAGRQRKVGQALGCCVMLATIIASFFSIVLLILFALLLLTGSAWADGEKFPVLKTTAGKEYKDVLVKTVEVTGIKIIHADGFAKIPFEQLSPELQKQFNFDPDKAKAAREEASAAATKKSKESAMLEASIRRAEDERRLHQKDAQVLTVKVSQSVKAGIIGRLVVNDATRDLTTGSLNVETYFGDVVFIETAQALADGELWNGSAYRAGIWESRDIEGVNRKIPKWVPLPLSPKK